MIDFSSYQFRPSQVGLIMTKSKTKGELSQTAKTFLEDLFYDSIYGQQPYPHNVQMAKGNYCEDEAIAIYRKEKQIFCTKNQQKFSNEFITGTPDLILPTKIVDIKCPFTNRTWAKYDHKQALDTYFWQLVSYCWLCNKRLAEIAVVGVDTPAHLLAEEVRSFAYKTRTDFNNE